jgi:hypothetical protein
VESKHAAIAGRQPEQLSFHLSGWNCSVPRTISRNVSNLSALFVNPQFGIAHDVDEKNVGDFQSEFRFLLGSHRGVNLGGSGKGLYINFGNPAKKSRHCCRDSRMNGIKGSLPAFAHCFGMAGIGDSDNAKFHPFATANPPFAGRDA